MLKYNVALILVALSDVNWPMMPLQHWTSENRTEYEIVVEKMSLTCKSG